MNKDNKWGPMEYLTLLGIGNLVYAFFCSAIAGVGAVLSMFRIGLGVFIGIWLLIGGWKLYDITPSWVIVLILVAVCTSVFLIGYNMHTANEKEKELKEQQENEEIEDYKNLRQFLADLPFHYYNAEKKAFSEWLVRNNLVKSFLNNWDDTYRLQRLGAITGKYYVCDLRSMTQEQQVAKREAAWNRQRNEQRQAQLKKNAELKAQRSQNKK